MILDVQFNSATTDWPMMREAVQASEAAGFGVAWVVDHMAGQMMGGNSMLEAFTLTGALAATTSTIGIGTLVVNVWNRSLGVLAVAAASAQHISDGRFWLGVGAGASPDSAYGAEHAAVGIELAPEAAARHQRVREFVAIANRMWVDGTMGGVSGFPVPSLRPPIIVGVNGERLARIAAIDADGINVRSTHPRLEQIIEAARDARPAGAEPLVITVWQRFDDVLLDPDSADRRRYDKIGLDRLILAQLGPVDLSLIRRP